MPENSMTGFKQIQTEYRLNSGGGRPLSGSEATKYRLAEAVKMCMKTTPVEDITVRSIAEKCGVARQTFYRNFLDKYDLINWYFDKLLLKSFEHMGQGNTINEGLVKKFEYIRKERVFFSAAFKCDEQNNLKEHDFELILAFYKKLIEEKSGRALSEELLFLLEFYCRGSIYMTVKWVLSGMKKTPEDEADMLVKSMPGALEAVVGELGLLKRV